ncbi:putative basic proline-rich protein-like isoform X2 [Iris pallida]|uniref:Basic proline-rich protein-like isoform X2 n=1 Tax=Iris pallida TaxID=29817 RepID=A0AAX6EV39_IRIPA|nr:putative basic proline-rich protein-like isoform X2 [Iris pallida]
MVRGVFLKFFFLESERKGSERERRSRECQGGGERGIGGRVGGHGRLTEASTRADGERWVGRSLEISAAHRWKVAQRHSTGGAGRNGDVPQQRVDMSEGGGTTSNVGGSERGGAPADLSGGR